MLSFINKDAAFQISDFLIAAKEKINDYSRDQENPVEPTLLEFERNVSAILQSLDKRELYQASLFLISSVLTSDSYQRPSPSLLEIFSNILHQTQVKLYREIESVLNVYLFSLLFARVSKTWRKNLKKS